MEEAVMKRMGHVNVQKASLEKHVALVGLQKKLVPVY
jgi:hypothetical protein